MQPQLSLTEDTFKLCIDALIKLPFTIKQELTDPSTIRVTKKNSNRNYEFDLWRINNKECSFSLSYYREEFGADVLRSLKIKNKYYNGKYLVELFWGPNSVDPYLI